MNSKNQDPRRRQRMAAEDSKTLEYRWGEANRKFDLAKKQIELFKSITSEKEKVLEQYLEASGHCRTLKKNKIEEKEKIFEAEQTMEGFLKTLGELRDKLEVVEKEINTFLIQGRLSSDGRVEPFGGWSLKRLSSKEYDQFLLNSFMVYEVGDSVFVHRSIKCTVSILEKKFQKEKWTYQVKLDGAFFLNPEHINDVGIDDAFTVSHDDMVFRLDEEGDYERRLAWPGIILKMQQEAYVERMKEPARRKMAEALAQIEEAELIATFPIKYAHIVPGTNCWWIEEGYAGPQKYSDRYEGTIISINLITFMCEISCPSKGKEKITKRIDTVRF